jgi:UDP-glucuronate 4-epimerase
MKIIITGAAGFIGSHLTDFLLAREEHIIGIDNFDPFYDVKIKEKNIENALTYSTFSLYRTDICDFSSISDILDKEKPDIIVHIAAKAGVRSSILDPIGYYHTNVEGTINLLECCKRYNINKFIFASTSSIYGNNQKVPFAENDPVDFPISPYAASKKSAELICHTYHHLYDLNIFALRFLTVYGPRQRPDLAIHKFFRLLDEGTPIPVYGDGTSSRDYTYIDDIIQGVVRSIERVSGFEIINLGESKTLKLNGLIRLIEDVTGTRLKKEYLPLQPGDVIQTYADIDKARKLLNYNPQTEMKEGLKKFYEWFLNSKSE